MFEKFTADSIKVITLAQEEARRLGHNFVGSEQILLGLISHDTSTASKLLKAKGITLKDARSEVEKIIGRGSGFVAIIPFTPRAKKIIETAWKEARNLGHHYLGTEHLLLGVIAQDDGVSARVFENLNIEYKRMRTEIIKAIDATIPSPRPDLTESIRRKEQGLQTKMLEHLEKSKYLPINLQPRQSPDLVLPTLDDFTDSLLNVILLARKECRRVGYHILGTEQILIALIEENSGVTGKVLKSAGCDLEKARLEVKRIIGSNPYLNAKYIPLSPRLKKVLVSAQEQAKQFGLLYITKEHLLLALLNESEGVSRSLIRSLNINVKGMREELFKLIGEQVDSD